METQEGVYDIHIRRFQNKQYCHHAACGFPEHRTVEKFNSVLKATKFLAFAYSILANSLSTCWKISPEESCSATINHTCKSLWTYSGQRCGQQKNHNPGLEYEGSNDIALLIENIFWGIINTLRCNIKFLEVRALIFIAIFHPIS